MDFSYPFKTNIIPNNELLNQNNLPDKFKIYLPLNTSLYPEFYNNSVVLTSGTEENKWDDHIKCMYLFCCLKQIPNIIFIWSDEYFYHFQILSYDFLNIFPYPFSHNTSQNENFSSYLHQNYGIGYCLQYNRSVRDTLNSYAGYGTFQLFVGAPDKDGKNSLSKRIPSFGYDNIPAFDVINERGLNVYCHARLNINMCSYEESDYIANLLNYCTGHGIKGAVFHVGSNTINNEQAAISKLITNIITGISKFISSLSPQQNTINTKLPNLCKFLLETPSGKGNEVLYNDLSFLNMCCIIKNTPNVGDLFGVCVDTCHVFSAGYSPYGYLINISKYINVELVHFNDSMTPFNDKKDRHIEAGMGYIPWYLLLKVAEFCKNNNIHIVNEYNSY